MYLWYNQTLSSWRLSGVVPFRAQTRTCWAYVKSTGLQSYLDTNNINHLPGEI